MIRLAWWRAAAAGIVAVVVSASALAGSATFQGTLSPGGATEPETALITTPNCSGGTFVFAVLYRAYPFRVTAAGTYNVSEPGTESAVYVYDGPFNPAHPANHCLAASNGNPISLDVNLSPGVKYTLVIIEDSFAQDGMSYAMTLSGPGAIVQPSIAAVPALSAPLLALLALALAAGGWLGLRRRA